MTSKCYIARPQIVGPQIVARQQWRQCGGTLVVEDHYLGHNNSGQTPRGSHFNATKYDANGKSLGALTVNEDPHFFYQPTHSSSTARIRQSTNSAIRPNVNSLFGTSIRAANGWQF